MDACRSAQLTGPTHGDFNLRCGGSGARICQSIVADASDMITWSLNVQISSSNAIISGTIKCPGNHIECGIFCSVANACRSMTVLLGDSNVSIGASGSNALQLSNICCPANG
eukprot:195780_1